MKQFKTEMHAHTAPVSDCGVATTKELVEIYKDAGYSTVVLTNHLSHRTYHDEEITDWQKAIDFYISDYKDIQKYCDDDFHVLLGIELCFDADGETDFLVYGITEEFLRVHGNLMKMSIKSFSKLAHEHGLLIVQAHPFRDNMCITPPDLIDGIEIENGNPRLDSRNDLAAHWAERFDLITTSGTDFHKPYDVPTNGIITDFAITSNDELLEVLRTNNKTVILTTSND